MLVRGVKVLAIALSATCLATCDLSTDRVVLGPHGQHIHYTGGDGSSFDTAIVIHQSKQDDGVPSESWYILTHYPQSQEHRQELVQHNGKMYSIRTFFDADGKQHTLYFDESDYYGKL